MERKIKILFLGANPRDTSRLSLDEEVRQILARIRGADQGARFEVASELALRPQELPAALMRHRPDIVHFSGHGTADGALCLVDDATKRTQPLSTEQLISFFKPLSSDIRCVVLSACYSAAPAQAIASCVPCVVGMSRAVKDATAMAFAAGFYQALAFGESVQTAFELGRAEAGLLTKPEPSDPNLQTRSLKKERSEEREPAEKEIPQLLLREGTDASKLVIAPRLNPSSVLSPESPAAVKKSIKMGDVTITGSNHTWSTSQIDTYAPGASASANRADKEIEIGNISISGTGINSSIDQNDFYGSTGELERSPSPLEQARELVRELPAALSASPLRTTQKQMAEIGISALKTQINSATPARPELIDSLDALRPVFASVPELKQLLDRLAQCINRLRG